MGNKNADTVTKWYNDKIVKTKPVEEVITPPEKGKETLNELRQQLQKWKTIKSLNYEKIHLYRNL